MLRGECGATGPSPRGKPRVRGEQQEPPERTGNQALLDAADPPDAGAEADALDAEPEDDAALVEAAGADAAGLEAGAAAGVLAADESAELLAAGASPETEVERESLR